MAYIWIHLKKLHHGIKTNEKWIVNLAGNRIIMQKNMGDVQDFVKQIPLFITYLGPAVSFYRETIL